MKTDQPADGLFCEITRGASFTTEEDIALVWTPMNTLIYIRIIMPQITVQSKISLEESFDKSTRVHEQR